MSATWDDLLAKQQAEAVAPGYENGRLAREWVVPPFTILDSAQGYWRERRRRWLALGIESELGRGGGDDRVGVEGGEWSSSRSPNVAIQMDGKASAKVRSGAKKGALHGTTTLMTDKYAGKQSWKEHPSYRRDADAHGNLTGAADLPAYADFGMEHVAPGTSIFDPVLCECSYRWFCPPQGTILDPFAGGSVRGIVAAMMGHPYTGIDLSAAQVAANREQAARIVPDHLPRPQWYVGDSRDVLPDLPAGLMFDMVFTCPPYYDLEVYSDDPRDLSAMGTYAEFAEAYRVIIEAALHRLRPGRFATFVVSDVRGPNGNYVGLRRDTEAFHVNAGAALYNDAVLVNAVGTVAMRAQKQMEATRKLGRMHQNVLVFAKGTIKTHEWDNAREAPPDPQQSLALDAPEPAPLPAIEAPAVIEAPTVPLAALEPAAAAEQAEPDEAPVARVPDAVGSDWATIAPLPEAAQVDRVEAPPAAPPASALPAFPNCGNCTHPYADHDRDGDTEWCYECEADYLVEPAIIRCAAYTSLGGLTQSGVGPAPPPDMMEIRPALDVPAGRCEQCGAEIERGHEHPPFVTPQEADGLFRAQVWDRADATPTDVQAMTEAGLWPDEA